MEQGRSWDCEQRKHGATLLNSKVEHHNTNHVLLLGLLPEDMGGEWMNSRLRAENEILGGIVILRGVRMQSNFWLSKVKEQ